MTDSAKSPNVIRNSVETIHSFPKVLLPSQFGAPCLDALTGIAATTQALAGQFLASRFDIAETLRSRFAAAQFHLAETLRGQFVLPRFEALIDIKSITHGIAETLQSYEREMSLYSDVAVLMEQADRVTAAGWIPHPALPIKELVGPETDTGKIAQFVERFVQENEENIYMVMAERFSSYQRISQDTLALCHAVIQAHRLKLFPLIVPAVFSEIERCARTALGVNSKQWGKRVIDNFVARVDDLPVSAFDIVQFPTLMLIETLIYESIPPDTEACFLNRHGSQHGIIRFNTCRDCMNAIFLLDFVLQSCEAIHDTVA